MQREHRTDRIQGVLFGARQTVFAGPAFHPRALLLSARYFAQRFTFARRHVVKPNIFPTHYRLSSNATEILRRFK